MPIKINPGKKLTIHIGKRVFERYTIKTHIIIPGENYLEILQKYALPHMEKGDILVCAEKALSISQGRVFHMDKVKVSKLARFLTKFVTKNPGGVGVSIPVTMQIAINEIGAPKIIWAAFIAAITKPFGIKGMFYKIAGPQVKAIDGPADYVIPPYNKYASLGPKEPQKLAEDLAKKTKYPIVIIDCCDLGRWILGASKNANKELVLKVLKDNPFGQTNEQTPLCIIREKR